MTDINFAPTKRAKPITLQQLRERLGAACLPSTVEDDSPEIHRLVFKPHESTICVSTMSDLITLATFNFGVSDGLEVGNTVEQVMDQIGFSPVEEGG